MTTQGYQMLHRAINAIHMAINGYTWVHMTTQGYIG